MTKRQGLNLANKITIARIICIPFFIAAIIYSRMDIALILFIVAIISDGADGFIARALKQKTQLGTIGFWQWSHCLGRQLRWTIG